MADERIFRGGLVVISGPSGSGKTTLVDRLSHDPRVDIAVTATTRPMRQGEVDGQDYFFLTHAEFRRRIAAGDFVEYNEVFRNGNLYGSLRQPLADAMRQRERCYVLEIDVEGGLTLKHQGFDGLYVFISPPSIDRLQARLVARGTESESSLRERLAKARLELELKQGYDVTIVNDDLERAYAELRDVLGLDVSGTETQHGGASGFPGGTDR